MSHPWQAFTVGLITLQLQTAFRIGNAEGDGLFDNVFVTDANGLPCLPGDSLAGVWRHALAGPGGDPETCPRCRQVFGFQDRDEGEASRIRISFGQVHGQDNRPVAFRGSRQKDDPVLRYLAAGAGRDHVRIGMHGAVDGRGKFDELVVPAGARFTFEVTLSKESELDLDTLVGYLARPEVRLGAGTRRGLGRFQVLHYRALELDLKKAQDLQTLSKLPVALEHLAGNPLLKKRDVKIAAGNDGWLTGEIHLKPIGTWMVGGGLLAGREWERRGRPEDEKFYDRIPMSERRILWKDSKDGQRGSVEPAAEALFLVPGSSVKGALRHRTAFHARRHDGQSWLDPADPQRPSEHPVETELFGAIRSKTGGRPGRFHLVDTYVSAPVQALQHVSLDRFTQGPMDHLLYDEVALGEAQLKLEVAVRVADLSEAAGLALEEALNDLCEGRLAFGAGRGHGRFLGEVRWPDGKTLKALVKEARS